MFVFADSSYGWTPHKVELALWSFCVADKLGMDLSKLTKSDKADKRKSGALQEAGNKKKKKV